jgi:predicted nucleotidyltransferase component of viral defense system
LRSGSKKSARRPPELASWQEHALRRIAVSALGREAVFGGGAALAALDLHHRKSEDLDFFLSRELEAGEVARVAASLSLRSTKTELEVVGPRTSIVLVGRSRYVGRIEFAFYPFEPVAKRRRWRDLNVESIEDMTVNKLQALLTRNQPRDFVDLYFLLREGPLRDLDSLLSLVRAKFDVGPHRLGLASRLLLVHDVKELPRMIRPVSLRQLVAFFEKLSRDLIRAEGGL